MQRNWNTAPVKGFVLGTVVHTKNATFQVQIYAAAKDNVKTKLTYNLSLITYKTPLPGHLRFLIFQNNFFSRSILIGIQFHTMLRWFWAF